ncbi:MAG: hypothetical protein U9O83_04290 [Campylobacterota bacterium]|nr:hypothetical protein [Campylobacterota bacterium]
MKERADARRKIITIQKFNLHSSLHHSFHLHLNLKDSWELLAKLSREAWIEKTGKEPALRVDKSICRFITLAQKV